MTLENAVKILEQHLDHPFLVNDWEQALDIALSYMKGTLSKMTHVDDFYLCNGDEHEFKIDEVIPNCTIEVLKCDKCGETSWAWKRS